MWWLLSNASSKDIIDCLQKGRSDTDMFKNDLFIKRNRNLILIGLLLLYFKRKRPELFPRGKNTKDQYYCEPDLESEFYL